MAASEQKHDNAKEKMIIPDWKRNDCIYTSCFCEENVWKLCKRVKEEKKGTNDCFAIFISNEKKQFPIWSAKAAQSQSYIIWDYHVIFLWINRDNPKHSLIFDFDSTLDFPCLFSHFLIKSFPPKFMNKEAFKQYEQKFRVVACQTYLDTFHCDRRHMISQDDGKWICPPPKYECIMIKKKKKGSNLMSHFVDMQNKEIGTVHANIKALNAWLLSK